MGALSQLGPLDWRQHFPEATADGIDRAEKHADDEWMLFALAAVCRVSRQKRTFTADDVAEVMSKIPTPPETHEKRAMGPVMMRAAKLGWCEQTDEYTRSSRAEQHGCPKRVWRSLQFRGTDAVDQTKPKD